MASTFESQFANNWARLKCTGEADPPSREYVGKELLFESNLLCARDMHSFIALLNRREFELCFYQQATLRRFLEQHAAESQQDKWNFWSIDSSVSIGVVNLVVKFWTGRVSDHDVEVYLNRYCSILQKPYKPLDQFGIWYGIRKYKVELKRDANNHLMSLPTSMSLGPYNGRLQYPGQEVRCFICNSTDHRVKECREVKCWKCANLGHKANACKNDAECSLCGQRGHSFFHCPRSFSNVARARRKSQAEEQQRQVLALLRTTRPEPAQGEVSVPLTAVQRTEPEESAPGGEEMRGGVEPAQNGRELGDDEARELQTMAGVGPQPQRVPSRSGRGRARRGFFAAAALMGDAASSTGTPAQVESQPSPCGPEVTAGEETEEAVRQLEKAVDEILPPWSDSSGVEDCAGIGEQRREERGEESEESYDSASEEPSIRSPSLMEHRIFGSDSDSSEEEGPSLLSTESTGPSQVSVSQKRQTSPLVSEEKKQKK